MHKKTRMLARSAVTAALYVALTVVSYPFSYGMVQFRISEIMTLLAWMDPSYIPGLLVGCAVANLLGTGGIVDVIFGTAASAFAFAVMLLVRKIKKEKLSLFISSLAPALSSFIIAFEMRFATGSEESFWLWFLWIAVGEFAVVTVLGCPIAMYLKKKNLLEIIKKEGR